MSQRQMDNTDSPPDPTWPASLATATTPATSSRATFVTLALILIVCGLLFLQTSGYALLGWDTYPIIISSRVQSFGDFLGNFTEKLMDGRHRDDFYRPLVNMSFALDYALWGLRSWGYQLTDVLLFAGCAASLYVLARRAFGSDCVVAPLVALAFFLLHPTHDEVLPIPARRPETLCCAFMMLSLAVQLSPKSMSLRRPSIAPAALALLAMASKETAFVLPAISFVLVLLYSPRLSFARRTLHAIIAIIPHAVAVAGLLGARIAILGGLGGHPTTSISEAFGRFPLQTQRILELLLFPQVAMQNSPVRTWLLIGLAVGLFMLSAFGLWSFLGRRKMPTTARRLLRTSIIAVAWLLLIGLTSAAAGPVRSWYLLLPAAGMALLVGALAEGIVARVRHGRLHVRLTAAPTLLLLFTLLVWQWRYSPLVCNYDEWDRGTKASRSFLEELHTRVADAEDGSIVMAPPIPVWTNPSENRPSIQGAAVLSKASVQAWAELVFPQRRIEVRAAPSARGQTVDADEVVVLLNRQLNGF